MDDKEFLEKTGLAENLIKEFEKTQMIDNYASHIGIPADKLESLKTLARERAQTTIFSFNECYLAEIEKINKQEGSAAIETLKEAVFNALKIPQIVEWLSKRL